jgi:hypothetical protein
MIDAKEVKVDKSIVKTTCTRIRGGVISDEAWKNWRAWAKILPSDTHYTIEQFQTLVAIARIRVDNQRGELDRPMIEKAKTSEDLASINRLLSDIAAGKFVHGTEVIPLLKEEFPDLSATVLRAAFGGKFNFNGWYDCAYVRNRLTAVRYA